MDAPRTVERKRTGRNVDVMGILPTPPRSRDQAQLPTPETVRRLSKRPTKTAPTEEAATILPTPQTLPRQPRKSERTPVDPTSPPSPSGHTTFFLSASSTSRPEGGLRRRPGLTFAQQMGLLNHTAPSASTSTNAVGRQGMGVGMGGMRTNGHGKVDQISYGRLGAPLPVEENPFLDTRPMGLVSPGAVTFHRPGSEEDPDNTAMASRPQLRAPQTRLQSSLLSPPPTQKALRIRTPPRSVRENAERQHKKEEMKRMMDAESNPFLSQPGELIQPGRAGLVDESSPTVTYVFRGAKKVFANPFLRPDQPFPAATLDPEDDEFEPHPCPDPRLLWPSGPGMEAGGSSSREASPPTSPVATPRFSGRERAGMGGDLDISGPKHAFTDEEVYASESEEELPARRGLLFTGGGGIKRASLGGEDGRAKAKKAKGRRL